FQLPQMEYTRFPGAADEPPRADAPTIISDYFAVYRFYVNDNNLLLVRRIIANVFGGTNIYAQSQSLRNDPKIYYSYTHSISNSSHNSSVVRDSCNFSKTNSFFIYGFISSYVNVMEGRLL